MAATTMHDRASAAYAEISGGEVEQLAWGSKAPATWLQYASMLRSFHRWCEENGDVPVPASEATLKTYMRALLESGRTVRTVQCHLTAISVQHRLRGVPINRAGLSESGKGMRRLFGQPARQARPMLAEEIQALLARLDPKRPADVRDGAMIVLGFACALRQSELTGLDWRKRGSGTGALTAVRDGLTLRLFRSKTSQEAPVDLVIPADSMPTAIKWVKAWVAMAGTADRAPLFTSIDRFGRISGNRLTAKSVAQILRKRMLALKIADGADLEDAHEVARATSGHSLRAGFCTQAAMQSVPEWQIRRRSRHSTPGMVSVYVRRAESWTDHSLKTVGF